MGNAERSKKYHRIKNTLFYVSLVLDIALLGFLQLSGTSQAIRAWAQSLTASAWGINALYVTAFCLIVYAAHWPINFFLGFIWEHRFGLSTQKFCGWLKDDVKKGIISFIFVLVIVEVIYFLLGRFEKHWWIGAGTAWLFLTLFLTRIMPNVIIPLFYKYSKVENEELRRSIFRLFSDGQVPLQDVYAVDFSSKTKKANAFVCGLGKKRRVVLGDTLLANFSIPEIESVLAHELGHYKRHDIAKLIFVNTVIIFAGFFLADYFLKKAVGGLGLGSIADIASLPVFAFIMMLFGFLTAPITNAYSRRLENQADLFSLRLTNNPAVFVTMMKKLGEMNLAEVEPSRFNEIMFYDHPPIGKRVRTAERFGQDHA